MLHRLDVFFRRHGAWLLPVAVFGLVLFCYWPAMQGVQLWDDPAHVPRPELRSWAGLGRIWTDFSATQQYYPVLFSAFWLEHRLWGDSMFGYHLCNAVLHALCCCLLAVVVRRLWLSREGSGVTAGPVATCAAWTSALLFAVHPACVESVAWITEQKNTLSLFFALLAAWAYLRYESNRRPSAYALATVLFVAALGSKTATVVLPPILLVLGWWRRKGWDWRSEVWPLVPWFALALGSGLLTNWIERVYIGAEGSDFLLSFWQRVLLAGRVVWFFLGSVFWPPDRSFFYRRWDVAAESAGWVVHLVAAVGVTILFWALRRRMRGPLAAWLVLGGALFPVLGFFNVFSFQFAFVADHYYYIAIACLLGAVASGGAWLSSLVSARLRIGAGVALVVVVGMLSTLSRGRSALFVDNETLFRDNIAKVPDSWMAYWILANSIAKTPGREVEAIAFYREMLRFKPDSPDGHLGLGFELAKNPENRSEAIALYERAIALRPNYIEAYNNLGALLSDVPGREAEAVALLETALRFKSDFSAARLNLGVALVRLPGRAAEALPHFEKALRGMPNSAEARFKYGNALARLPGRMGDAAAQFAEAVRLDPGSPDYRTNLGNALASLAGRRPEALVQYREVLRLDPARVAVRNNAAMLLGEKPEGIAEAEALVDEGLRLDPGSAPLLNTRGILAAQLGRFEEARTYWERAVRADPAFDLARENLARLEQMGR